MTDRLEEIKARMEATTPGPWGQMYQDGIPTSFVLVEERFFLDTEPFSDDGQDGIADAEFIAHSRADVEWLMQEVERLQGAVNATLDYLESDHDLDSRQEVVAFAHNQLEHADTREES